MIVGYASFLHIPTLAKNCRSSIFKKVAIAQVRYPVPSSAEPNLMISATEEAEVALSEYSSFPALMEHENPTPNT